MIVLLLLEKAWVYIHLRYSQQWESIIVIFIIWTFSYIGNRFGQITDLSKRPSFASGFCSKMSSTILKVKEFNLTETRLFNTV